MTRQQDGPARGNQPDRPKSPDPMTGTSVPAGTDKAADLAAAERAGYERGSRAGYWLGYEDGVADTRNPRRHPVPRRPDGRAMSFDDFIGKLENVRPQGKEWMARCPAHDDNRASLAITAGDHQPVLLYCHAGCETKDVLAAIGLTLADISKRRDP